MCFGERGDAFACGEYRRGSVECGGGGVVKGEVEEKGGIKFIRFIKFVR